MTTVTARRVLGIDACKRGWVAVELRDGAFVAAHIAGSLEDLLAPLGSVEAVGVDMPLGLLSQGWRRADQEAARTLGALRSAVFRVPPRPAWEEINYSEAVARCRALNGLGFSRQAWGLRDKLLEANVCMAAARYPIHEVHPEITFRAMPGPAPRHSKKTWAGQAERRRSLNAAGIVLPDDLGDAGRAAPDDVLDAAAAAWSADRIARGEARSIPDPPQQHADSPAIAIWY